MTVGGGILATIFPLVALGACMGYYFYVRHSWLVLLLGFSFGIVGFASGKRTIFFVLPIFFTLYLCLWKVLTRYYTRVLSAQSIARHLAICGIIVSPIALYGLLNTNFGLRDTAGWTLEPAISSTVKYAQKYEFV